MIEILKKKSDLRTETEINILVTKLRESRFFLDQNYKSDILFKIGQIAEYKAAAKDQVVFEQGDVADHFYLVMDGKVSVEKLNRQYIDLQTDLAETS